MNNQDWPSECKIDSIGQNGFHYNETPDTMMGCNQEGGMNRFDGEQLGNLWLAKHGHRAKEATSPTYSTWTSMHRRCSDKSNENYGGAGIEVCQRWGSFELFILDMGERPDGCTIDRINPRLGYHPENCRWANSHEQAKNRRTTIMTEINGESLMLSEVSRKYEVPMTTVFRRYKQGIRGAGLVSRNNRNSLRLGEKCGTSKLSGEEVVRIKERLKSGDRVSAISRDFGVSQPTISNIKSGATWGHINI